MKAHVMRVAMTVSFCLLVISMYSARKASCERFFYTLETDDPYRLLEENVKSHVLSLDNLLGTYELKNSHAAEDYYVILRICYQAVWEHKVNIGAHLDGDRVPAAYWEEGKKLKDRFLKWAQEAYSIYPMNAYLAELHGDALYHLGYAAAAAAMHFRAIICGRDVRLLYEKMMLDYELMCDNFPLQVATGATQSPHERRMFLYGSRDILTEEDWDTAKSLCLYYEERATRARGPGFPESGQLHEAVTNRITRPEQFWSLVARGQEYLARYMIDDPMDWEKRRAQDGLKAYIAKVSSDSAIRRQAVRREKERKSALQRLSSLEALPNGCGEILSVVERLRDYALELKGEYEHIPNWDRLEKVVGEYEAEVCDLYYRWHTRTGDMTELGTRVDGLLGEHKEDERLLLLKVKVLHSKGDVPAAMAVAKKILGLYPGNVYAAAWLERMEASQRSKGEK